MRPKIIHTIETAEPGGAEKILVQVADGLRGEYVPTGVVLQHGWTSDELDRLGIPVVHMPLVRSFDLTWVGRMVKFIRENNINLIHSHEFTSNAYSVIAARLAKIPIICTVHGKNYYPDRFYRRFSYRQVARYANEFIAVSYDLRTFISSQIGIPSSRIRVVHNGIDTRKYDKHGYDRTRLRSQLELPEDVFVIIVVAALFEMKGHKDLIAAIHKYDIDKGKLRVLFVGDGDYREQLHQLAVAAGVDRQIRFLGFRDDIAEMLSLSDLFVLPSYSEGLPVSVLEAMATGLPVISTDVGGLREILRDGENAFLVPPAKPEQLAEKIGICMQDRPLAIRLATRARQDVINEFDILPMLDTYRRIYRSLVPQ